MRDKVYADFDAAVADIPDGASIMLSGFAGPGTARNLIAALHRQGAKGLTLISNTPGRWQDDRIDSGVLVKDGPRREDPRRVHGVAAPVRAVAVHRPVRSRGRSRRS